MSKFVLIGGRQDEVDNQEFAKAISLPQKERTNLLICLFAIHEEEWDNAFEENKKFFKKLFPNENFEFTLATERDFELQVMNADVIFFSGGSMIPLFRTLAAVGNNWMKHIKNQSKIVIGTSAGTDMLSKYCYDVEQDHLEHGLGLVNIKTIVHYGAEKFAPKIGWEKAAQLLKNYKEPLDTFLLHEGEFIVVD